MSKHTPGPWSADVDIQHEHYKNKRIQSAHGRIAEVSIFPLRHRAESEANACLIEAAPELLEALQGIVGPFEAWAESQDGRKSQTQLALRRIKRARAAIAKAEGK